MTVHLVFFWHLFASGSISSMQKSWLLGKAFIAAFIFVALCHKIYGLLTRGSFSRASPRTHCMLTSLPLIIGTSYHHQQPSYSFSSATLCEIHSRKLSMKHEKSILSQLYLPSVTMLPSFREFRGLDQQTQSTGNLCHTLWPEWIDAREFQPKFQVPFFWSGKKWIVKSIPM